MKIIRLSSKNVKNLKAIEIAPDGNIVTLSGKNGAGKSAILDSIFSTLTGKRLKDAIRHGEERADVEIDMGEFVVRKRWTAKGEAIEVSTTNEEGKKTKFTSPQTFLDEVVGELSFDPLAFQKMKSEAQVELLKKIVGLDFADLEKESDGVYGERTALNSRIKEAIAHLSNTEAPDPKTPDKEIAFKDSLKKLQDLRDKREHFLSVQQTIKEGSAKIEAGKQWIADKEEEIAKIQDSIKSTQKSLEQLDKEISTTTMPEQVTQEQIIAAESALEDLEHKNADIRAAKRYREAVRSADKLKKAADVLTEKLRRIAQDKQTRVAATKMPIAGLSISDNGVSYSGMLFDRLSTGQQIRVSTAIGMALNPKLEVIFIREGSFLDSDGLKEIAAMAKGRDYQVWIEKCDETGQVGFFIEAGEITAVDGKKIAKETK